MCSNMNRKPAACWAALVASLVCLATEAQELLAIRGGRVLPISSEPIDNGVVLIRDGKITAVGKALSIPIDAKVIDATGKVVMPGFIEPHSSGALSQSNEVNPIVPFLSVIDGIDPGREFFDDCRRNGVTTVAVVPGNATMIGGQAAIIKTAGTYVDDMILKRHAGIKISVSPTAGTARMSHYNRLRRELQRARDAVDGVGDERPNAERPAVPAPATGSQNPSEERKDEQADRPAATDPSQADAQRAAMAKLVKGEFPAFLYCANGMDALQAIQLVETFKLKAVLVAGRDCYQAIDAIARSKLPVILDENLVSWRTDPRTGEDEKIVLPKLYRDGGVSVTFQSSGATASTLGNSFLWYQAAIAVKYGTPLGDALKAITARPAEILGIAQFVGTLEPKKDADIVILSGDPLKIDTWVETTIVNGRVVYERSNDDKLRRLVREPRK